MYDLWSASLVKVVRIIEDANLDVVCQLGGFHTMKSFLGLIDNLIKGSGIEELFDEKYAEYSVVHMMPGKAVSRALLTLIKHCLLTESASTTFLIEILTERRNAVVTDIESIFSHVS